MSELDQSDNDADDEITRLYGNSTVETMRGVYGEEFAKAFEPLNKLSDVLSETGSNALEWLHRVALRKDHRDGSLATKLSNTIL